LLPRPEFEFHVIKSSLQYLFFSKILVSFEVCHDAQCDLVHMYPLTPPLNFWNTARSKLLARTWYPSSFGCKKSPLSYFGFNCVGISGSASQALKSNTASNVPDVRMKSFTRCTVTTRAGCVYVPAVAFAAPTARVSKEHERKSGKKATYLV
jgi:hypothetical protein